MLFDFVAFKNNNCPNMNMNEEASNLSTFDIYSDLLLEQQTPGVHVSVDQLEKANVENEAKVKQLDEQLQSVQLQCKTLEEENSVLKRNISELFKTAQAELRRKDRQMKELENRTPRYGRERQNYKTSINDRLRDLRNTPKGSYNNKSSGAYHETVNGTQGPGNERGTDSTKKPADTEQVNPPGQNERPDRTSAEISLTGSDQIRNGERISKNSDNHSEERLLVKAESMKKYSYASQSRSSESQGRHRDKNQPVRNPHRETSRRSPNKSRDHRERTQHETLPRQRSPEHKQRTDCSSSKHSNDSVGDDRLHSQSQSPYRSRSSERSKSRGRSRGSDRSSKCSDSRERKPELVKIDNDKKKEKAKEYYKEKRTESKGTEKSNGSQSRRKRKHSSGRKQDAKSSHRSSHAALHKKLRGHDKDKFREASDARRPQCNHAEGNNGYQETPVSTDLIHKRNHRTSHAVSKRSSKGSVCDDQHSRMRHKSDRKNKSLKRAKYTLHRKHSTPKKHRREERSRRLSSSSKPFRSKNKTNELVVAGDKDMDNQDSSDTEWVPKEPVECDDPQYRKSLAAVMREDGVIHDDLDIPEEDPSLHTAFISSHNMPQNHDLEVNEEFTSDSLYGCKVPESTVKEGDKINSAECEGKVNKTTTSQSGTDDQEVVDDQRNTDIHHDDQRQTKPSQFFDTCQMEISKIPTDSNSLPAQENESEATRKISSVILPPSESCNPSSSGVGECASASQVNETAGSNNSSSSNPSTATESRTVSIEDFAPVKVGTEEKDVHVPSNSKKDLNCIESSEETELTDAALDEHVGNIDESKVDRSAGEVSIGEDSGLKQNAISLESCSKSKVSTKRKTNDSFSEKILDVFGSNSFLWSDDVDSSMEVTLPRISDTVDLSLAKASQDNSGGDARSILKPSKKLECFSETLLNIFGSDSFIEGEDMETSKVALPNLTDVASDETLQGNKDFPKGLPRSTEIDLSVDHENKSGSILETILETYDNGSLTGNDVKLSSRTSPMQVLVTEEPMIQSEDAMFETLQSSSAEKRDSKAKNDGGDPTSAATCNVDFRSSRILHGQEKLPWCQSDEHNTDATIKLLTKNDTQNSYQKEDETGFRSDTDVVTDMTKSTGKLLETASEKPEATVEKEYVDKPKLENQAINQEGVLTKVSPTASLGEAPDETPGHSEPNEQADLDRIPGMNIVSSMTSDVSIPDNIDMKSTLKTDFTDTVNALAEHKDRAVDDSGNPESHLEAVHEANISIDPSGYDLLSCSASPVHGDLLTDSENSCHSDQEYHADQVSDDQLSDQHVDNKQSENCYLSEGEIASSDSETSTNVISKKEEAHQAADRKAKRTRSKSLQKRSKREDKHSSSHKARDRSRDRPRKTVTGHNRLKFLEEKRRILEERQHALENPVRRHSESKYGINTAKDREGRPQSSIRRRLPSRESPEKSRAKKTAAQPRSRQEDRRDEKRRDVHLDDVARSRGSQSNCHQSSRRHDRDQCHDRPGGKAVRRTTESAEDLKRPRSSRTHRR